MRCSHGRSISRCSNSVSFLGILVGRAFGSLGVLFAISTFAVFYARRAPYFVVGWGWFLVTLMPVLGLALVGDQVFGDLAGTYLPSIGLFIAVVWGVAALTGKPPIFPMGRRAGDGHPRWAPRLRAIVLLAGHSLVFEHAAEATSGNALAYAILAAVLISQKAKFHRASSIAPRPFARSLGLPEALCVLGRNS